jgi:hypothetical protein
MAFFTIYYLDYFRMTAGGFVGPIPRISSHFIL